jgi:hypothetical protein
MESQEPITSLDELRRRVPSIIEEVNADTTLMQGALVNPLLALEALGYRLTEDVWRQAERRVRFKPEVADRLEALSAEVFQVAGVRFDIDSPDQLWEVLFRKLELQLPVQDPRSRELTANELQLVPALFPRLPVPDPLEPLRPQHPVIPLLLDYRQLEVSEARLAPRDLFERVHQGELKLPVTRARARLKRLSEPK